MKKSLFQYHFYFFLPFCACVCAAIATVTVLLSHRARFHQPCERHQKLYIFFAKYFSFWIASVPSVVLSFLSIINIHTSEYTMRFGFFFAMSLLFVLSTFLFHFSFVHQWWWRWCYCRYCCCYCCCCLFLFLSLFYSFEIFFCHLHFIAFFDMPNSNCVRFGVRDMTKTYEREGATEKDIDSVCLRGMWLDVLVNRKKLKGKLQLHEWIRC